MQFVDAAPVRMFISRVVSNPLPFNSLDDTGKVFVNRISFLGKYQVVNGLPRFVSVVILLS